jgi:hypothetical protein
MKAQKDPAEFPPEFMDDTLLLEMNSLRKETLLKLASDEIDLPKLNNFCERAQFFDQGLDDDTYDPCKEERLMDATDREKAFLLRQCRVQTLMHFLTEKYPNLQQMNLEEWKEAFLLKPISENEFLQLLKSLNPSAHEFLQGGELSAEYLDSLRQLNSLFYQHIEDLFLCYSVGNSGFMFYACLYESLLNFDISCNELLN